MADRGQHTWQTRETTELFEAIRSLKSLAELESFLRDLCTLSELEAMAHRWEVARLVDQGLPYLEIAERTGASTATVTRVAHWLHHGEGGYRLAPDRAERTATPRRSPSRAKGGCAGLRCGYSSTPAPHPSRPGGAGPRFPAPTPR